MTKMSKKEYKRSHEIFNKSDNLELLSKIKIQPKLKCLECIKMATWINAKDASIYYCDTCVPRGCSCNLQPADNNASYEDEVEWVQEYVHGRLFPCCEFNYNEEGHIDHN